MTTDHTQLPERRRAPIAPDRVGVERPLLPRHIRWAVLVRDGHQCRFCGCTSARRCGSHSDWEAPRRHARMVDLGVTPPWERYRPGPVMLEIDHVMPWSAGGSDHPVNLRALCEPCNQERSNYIDDERDHQQERVVWSCVMCEPGQLLDPHTDLIEAFCTSCRRRNRAPYVAELIAGGPIPTAGVPPLTPDVDPDPPMTLRRLARRTGVTALELAIAREVRSLELVGGANR